MADFLIKNTNHWMDALSPEEVQNRIDDVGNMPYVLNRVK